QQLDPCAELECLRLSRPQNCDQQRRDRYPAKHVEIRKRKDQNLQGSRKQHQQPGTLMNMEHNSRIAKGRLQAFGFRLSASGSRLQLRSDFASYEIDNFFCHVLWRMNIEHWARCDWFQRDVRPRGFTTIFVMRVQDDSVG